MATRYRDRRASANTGTTLEEATPETTGRTVIYCRISLDAEGDGLGVERQEKECRELCQRNGWQVDDVVIDNDISATTGKRRAGFESILANPPVRVVTWHTDRLVRVTADLERILALEVPVVTVTSGDIDLASPAGRAVARTIVAWATYEGEQKALRQASSHRQRAERGEPFWSHRRPFGYTEKGELHPTEAPALRECFSMLQKGETFAACATYLTDNGFTTTLGRKWNGSKLSRTMRHPRNAGLLIYQSSADRRKGNAPEIWGRGEWEPMVTEEEWRSILARSEATAGALAMTGKPQGERVKSLLGGIAECAECGDRVRQTYQHSTKKNRETGDVEKVRNRVYQPHCHHVSIPADWLDEYVSKKVLKALTSPARALLDGPEVAPEEAQEAAAEAVRLRDALQDVALREVAGEITRDQMHAMTARLREQLEATEAKAMSYYSASPLDRAYNASEILAFWKSGELSLEHRRDAVIKYVIHVKVRKRKNRNERANASMIDVKLKVGR